MPNRNNEAKTFFNRESSWALSHGNKQSHVVVFSTQNGLALAVLVYMNGSDLATIHFPAATTSEAKADAIEWAKKNIDSNLSVAKN